MIESSRILSGVPSSAHALSGTGSSDQQSSSSVGVSRALTDIS